MVKLFLAIVLLCIFLGGKASASISDEINYYIFALAPSLILIASAIFDKVRSNETMQNRANTTNLAQRLLYLAMTTDKPISVYEARVRIGAEEDSIRTQLERFRLDGIAEKYINIDGQELYKIKTGTTLREKKDILDPS
jgi:hypothetical protein